MLPFSSFRTGTQCKPAVSAGRRVRHTERAGVMARLRRLAILVGVCALVPVGAASASSSGGAAVVPPQSPKGFDSSAVVYTAFSRTLRKGNRGQDVKTLQTWLSELGYTVHETGYFDGATKRMVARFQRAHHLKPPSGTVGAHTAAALLGAVKALPQSSGTVSGGGSTQSTGSSSSAWVFPIQP